MILYRIPHHLLMLDAEFCALTLDPRAKGGRSSGVQFCLQKLHFHPRFLSLGVLSAAWIQAGQLSFAF